MIVRVRSADDRLNEIYMMCIGESDWRMDKNAVNDSSIVFLSGQTVWVERVFSIQSSFVGFCRVQKPRCTAKR